MRPGEIEEILTRTTRGAAMARSLMEETERNLRVLHELAVRTPAPEGDKLRRRLRKLCKEAEDGLTQRVEPLVPTRASRITRGDR